MWLSEDKYTLLEQKRNLRSWEIVVNNGYAMGPYKVLAVLLLFTLLGMFLPWTQTVRAPGYVTTRLPQQRPQQVNAVIAGMVDKWYVKEGDVVNAGDTILKLTEVKDAYLDPKLIDQTQQQVNAKTEAVAFYMDKTTRLAEQLNAAQNARKLKIEQARNKVVQARAYLVSDSANLVAAEAELKIAKAQYLRQEQLYKEGLKSLTELEQRRQALQNMEAKVQVAVNKLANARNDLTIALLEVDQVQREYDEKLAKIEAERFTVLSDASTTRAEIAKLQNQVNSYKVRSSFYYVTAPQAGQVTKTIASGIGEMVKEGDLLVTVVPKTFQYAVEAYVRPLDLPLITIGQKVQFQFEGWPAIVFRGWPGLSYGTFPGRVVSIDNNISDNGKFRILVAEDPALQAWPTALKAGGGALGIALLKDVPLWYEIWRNLNGFPPDFYKEPVAEKPADDKQKDKP